MRPRWYPVWEATSLSARRAWIEILIVVLLCHHISVALRKESVDRNTNSSIVNVAAGVALRKESVDRNIFAVILICVHPAVALRKESVDRNPAPAVQGVIAGVALRKESVDRNSS